MWARVKRKYNWPWPSQRSPPSDSPIPCPGDFYWGAYNRAERNQQKRPGRCSPWALPKDSSRVKNRWVLTVSRRLIWDKDTPRRAIHAGRSSMLDGREARAGLGCFNWLSVKQWRVCQPGPRGAFASPATLRLTEVADRKQHSSFRRRLPKFYNRGEVFQGWRAEWDNGLPNNLC